MVKEDLNNSIKEADATIIGGYSIAPEVNFLRKNLRSVHHNLISNAIKYRSAEPKAITKSQLIMATKVLLFFQRTTTGLVLSRKKRKRPLPY